MPTDPLIIGFPLHPASLFVSVSGILFSLLTLGNRKRKSPSNHKSSTSKHSFHTQLNKDKAPKQGNNKTQTENLILPILFVFQVTNSNQRSPPYLFFPFFLFT